MRNGKWIVTFLAALLTWSMMTEGVDAEERGAPVVKTAHGIVPPPTPSVWVAPNTFSARDGEEFLTQPKKMDYVLNHASVINFFIDEVYPSPNSTYGNVYPQLDFAIPLLKERTVEIGIEAGGMREFACDAVIADPVLDLPDVGEWMADTELDKIDYIYAKKGKVSYLSMDDPISHMLAPNLGGSTNTCNFDMATAVREVVDYMQRVHKNHPEIKIGYITNFPNRRFGDWPSYWGEKTGFDFKQALKLLMEETAKRGERLHYVQSDNPFDYIKGMVNNNYPDCQLKWSPGMPLPIQCEPDWIKRQKELQDVVARYGLDFGMIINADRGCHPGDNCTSSDQQFYQDVMSYIDLLRPNGLNPKFITIESWYVLPSVVLPENQPYSFMYTTKKAMEKLGVK